MVKVLYDRCVFGMICDMEFKVRLRALLVRGKVVLFGLRQFRCELLC